MGPEKNDSHRAYNFSQGFLVEGRENVYTGRSTLKEARTYDCFSHKRPVIWQNGDGLFFLRSASNKISGYKIDLEDNCQ